MTSAPRVIARLVACLTAIAASSCVVVPAVVAAPSRPPRSSFTSALAVPAVGKAATAAVPPRTASKPAAADTGPLAVSIDRLGADVIDRRGPLVVEGTVENLSKTPRLRVQAYLQLSPTPATDLAELKTLADLPDDEGVGTPNLAFGEYARLGTLRPGAGGHFEIRVPFEHLLISGDPGVYRLAIKVLSSAPDGTRDTADAARANTVLPLLPEHARRLTPVQAVTLLPLTAPVKRLGGGAFADDSLVGVLASGGRLANVLQWALSAAPDTVQVVIDPALLTAVTDMADGYRIAIGSGGRASVGGRGSAVASKWLADFQRLSAQQHVALLPWGNPAADTLAANGLQGPVTAAIRSSEDFIADRGIGSAVTGWLPGARTSTGALSAFQDAGADIAIVSADSLPGLRSARSSAQPPPSRLDIAVGDRIVPALVATGTVAGRPTAGDTSPLQFRQRLLAEAALRSTNGQTQRMAVTALPFHWNPGPPVLGQDFASAFTTPVLVAQSVVGAVDRPGVRYDGVVRPRPTESPAFAPAVLTAVRQLSLTGGNLAAILSPSESAQRTFQRSFAMSGSSQWLTFPRSGADVISRVADADRAVLARVTVAGPPFVAMSSNSGRFPLTVTNGLDEPVTVTLAVIPENPALSIRPLPTIVLPPGQRRDVQVITEADGSGVTSVRARLTTPGGQPFGTAWQFDVRSTQIGVVIWVVMGVGAAILFGAAGFRIVNRLRGNETARRQPGA